MPTPSPTRPPAPPPPRPLSPIESLLSSSPPAATTRSYYTYAATGHFLAVEKVGWKPTKAIGPLQVADLHKPIESLDWANAQPADNLNVRFLIPLTAAELAFRKSGRQRYAVLVRTGGSGPAAMNAARRAANQ